MIPVKKSAALRCHDSDSSHAEEPLNHSKPRVICVEDDEDIREIYEMYFTAAGYEVRTVENGLELGCLLTEFEPNLVTVDLRMPVLDGQSTLKMLISSQRLAGAKLMIISGFADESSDSFAAKHDIPQLSKPIERDTLIQKANELVRLSRKQRLSKALKSSFASA